MHRGLSPIISRQRQFHLHGQPVMTATLDGRELGRFNVDINALGVTGVSERGRLVAPSSRATATCRSLFPHQEQPSQEAAFSSHGTNRQFHFNRNAFSIAITPLRQSAPATAYSCRLSVLVTLPVNLLPELL
nr:unnamed protein product [Spirometra erinaceieuropaei]